MKNHHDIHANPAEAATAATVGPCLRMLESSRRLGYPALAPRCIR